MGELSFKYTVNNLSDGTKCVVGKFIGSIDASTNMEFEDSLVKLLDQKLNQVVLNLSALTYISSSGLGVLLRCVQKCRGAGGDIKITQVPANIWTIFRTVGMNSIFEILGSDKDALRNFQEQASYKPITKHRYPARFKCPSCSGPLEITKPGKYRCPHCTSYFAAEDTGAVKAFISRRPKILEARILGDTDNGPWIKGLVRSQAQWLNFNEAEIGKLEEAVDKTYRLCISQMDKPDMANGRLVIKAGKKELVIGLVCLDGSLPEGNVLKNNPDWQTIRQLVDRIEIVPTAPQGQIVKLVKLIKT